MISLDYVCPKCEGQCFDLECDSCGGFGCEQCDDTGYIEGSVECSKCFEITELE